MTAGEKEPGPGLAKRMLFETRPEQAIAIKLSCSLITTVVVLGYILLSYRGTCMLIR